MAEAPTGDESLTPDDAVNVLEEILEAQNHSRFLGLKLNVPDYIVTGIYAHYTDPKERLYYVLVEFLKQVDPRPTWRVIVAALRSPAVNLPQLAMRIEAAHFPDSTATCNAPPETATSTVTRSETHRAVSPQQGQMTVQYVQAKIKQFEKRFKALKKSTRECLERLRVPVKRVADALTSLPAGDMDEHKQFLESHLSALYQAPDHSELFGTMNFHWNYQNPQLLDHLIGEFDLEGVKGEMKKYKEDLQQFRKKTPLKLFCQSQKKKHIEPPPDFRVVVAGFDWPDDVTLEVVEEFRQEYADHYSLHKCAMMLAVVLSGSFIITWFIPGSIVEKLKVKIPKSILKKYSVTKLEVAGECVYPKATNKMSTTPLSDDGQCDAPSSSATGPYTAGTLRRISVQSSVGQDASQTPLTEQNFLFVEQPSKKFFCPVTYGLLLHPHLTSCCGNHLSEAAAMRIQGDTAIWIQGEGGACPMCNMPDLVTLPDKCFLRQVKMLRVFCYHNMRGCKWQGELFDLDHHLQSCPYSDLSRSEKTSGAELDRTRHPVHETKEVLSTSESTPIPSSTTNERTSSEQPLSTKKHIPFVEQPSDDLYCPVTHRIMLQPHLTVCCGKHLSQEAATWLRSEGRRCPLCKKLHLKTVLDERFRRQVNELRVFCRHEDRGCGWQGELSELEYHVQSCPMKDLPLMTDLKKLPVYSDGDVTSGTGQGRTRYRISSHVQQTPQTNTSSTSQQQLASYTCHVSGPGLQSATANHPTHVIVELTDSSNRPCSVPQKVTAQLELIYKATPTSSGRWPWFAKPHAAMVITTSPSQYELSYTAISRGQHKLHVRLNDIEINGSPFTMTVYPDPTQLAHPVRVVTGLNYPYGIAVNSHGEMVVSDRGSHQIAIRGQKIQTFGKHGDSAEQTKYPAGIAIDDADNIYVTSYHKLQKFTSSGELIKCVGQWGSKEGEFNEPRGLALYDNQVYVCDRDNNRIQVFDLDLNFIRSIGSRGKGKGEFKAPFDVKFDTAGHIYVADFDNNRVQVMDKNGQFIRIFGQNGLCKPSGLHIVDKYMYVSDYRGDRIVVYGTSGQFVTSFGGRGPNQGKFWVPYGITSCADGYIYVCDYLNNRVQIF